MLTKSTFAVNKFKNMVNNINFDYFVKINIYSELCQEPEIFNVLLDLCIIYWK